jgi:hypothetical protein
LVGSNNDGAGFCANPANDITVNAMEKNVFFMISKFKFNIIYF